MGPKCNPKCSYKEETDRNLMTEEKVRRQQRHGCKPKNASSHQNASSWTRQDIGSPLQPPERTGPEDTDFSPVRLSVNFRVAEL